MQIPSAGAPIDPDGLPVGHRSAVVHDLTREGRPLPIELWHPAAEADDAAPFALYEVLPGISFASAAARAGAPVRAGRWPLVLLSHGRTGTRFAYSGLCEALAGRGAIVATVDHAGDVLMDWLSGRQADDRSNEVARVGDAHAVLDAVLDRRSTNHPVDPRLPDDVLAGVDRERVALVGHSYGAYTAFAAVAGARGVGPHPAVRAVVGLQAYTRAMSDTFLARVATPALLVVSELDRTTPPASDGERPWDVLPGRPLWRLDLEACGHHASSDVPLYAELVREIDGVPDLARQYLEFTAAESAGHGAPPWRTTQLRTVRAVWAFLQQVLDIDPAAAERTVAELAATEGVSLRRR